MLPDRPPMSAEEKELVTVMLVPLFLWETPITKSPAPTVNAGGLAPPLSNPRKPVSTPFNVKKCQARFIDIIVRPEADYEIPMSCNPVEVEDDLG